jgi:acyl-CoA synthetase (AMP-forming)/AMP-acid ligase II
VPCELTHLTPCQDLVAAATAAAKAHSLTAKDTLVLTAPLHTPFGFVSGAVAAAITGAKVRPVWFPAHYPHRHTKLSTNSPCSLCVHVPLLRRGAAQVVLPTREFDAAAAAEAILKQRASSVLSSPAQAAAIAAASPDAAKVATKTA